MSTDSKHEQIENVFGNIFIGSMEATKNEDRLKQSDIKVIINVSANDNEVKYDDIKYYFYKLYDVDTLVSYLDLVYFDILSLLKNMRDHKENILVHCHAGINRSALIIGLYLIFKYKFKASGVINLLSDANQRRNLPVLTNSSFRSILSIISLTINEYCTIAHNIS